MSNDHIGNVLQATASDPGSDAGIESGVKAGGPERIGKIKVDEPDAAGQRNPTSETEVVVETKPKDRGSDPSRIE